MIDEIITSKTRVKLLRLFLTHIDDRYYLRELERMLNESLSPLRRQLLRLEKMGILVTEEEANLKYYRLNKNFAGIEELKNLVLGPVSKASPWTAPSVQGVQGEALDTAVSRQTRMPVKIDLLILVLVSLFVLGTSIFVVYAGMKGVTQVADMISQKPQQLTGRNAIAASPDEMVSKKWKVKAGSFPVLSSGEAGVEKRSEEL